MTTRQIRKTCEALVDRLHLPVPFSTAALIEELSAVRGRPIRIHTLPTSLAGTACGLWIATDTSDEIYVEEHTTQFHRDHIILHEIGHILLEHGTAEEVDPRSALAQLFPHVSPTLINRLLARNNYTSEQEQEAELVASLIHAAAERLTPSSPSGVSGELKAALGIQG
ncbi:MULTISPECIES: hypothetical protein [Streptomyces]|uniref:IrrE N-terminal-like domain-containing protein n=1 Tax=Streptomyces luteosporeus TaxID=173856 RepID=A0ABN3TK90_9ACTN